MKRSTRYQQFAYVTIIACLIAGTMPHTTNATKNSTVHETNKNVYCSGIHQQGKCPVPVEMPCGHLFCADYLESNALKQIGQFFECVDCSKSYPKDEVKTAIEFARKIKKLSDEHEQINKKFEAELQQLKNKFLGQKTLNELEIEAQKNEGKDEKRYRRLEHADKLRKAEENFENLKREALYKHRRKNQKRRTSEKEKQNTNIDKK